jgi:hypothetical protein
MILCLPSFAQEQQTTGCGFLPAIPRLDIHVFPHVSLDRMVPYLWQDDTELAFLSTSYQTLSLDGRMTIEKGIEMKINRPRVFISHSKKDIDFVKKLYDDLRKCMIAPWLDSEEIRAGNLGLR